MTDTIPIPTLSRHDTLAYEYSTSYPMSDLRSPVFTRLRRGAVTGWLRVLTLLVVDNLLLGLAWKLVDNQQITGYGTYGLLTLLMGIQTSLIAIQGLYRSGEHRRNYFRLFKTLSFAQLLFPLIVFYYGSIPLVSKDTFLWSWIFSVSFVCLGRFLVDRAIAQVRKQGAARIPVFVIGRPEDQASLIKPLAQENRYEVLDWLNIEELNSSVASNLSLLKTITDSGAAQVFICSWDAIENRMFLYWSLRNAGITIRLLPTGSEIYSQLARLDLLGSIPSVKISPPLVTGSDFLFKRLCDIVGASCFLALTFPVYIIVAILIKLDSSGPVFYKQTRIGLHGKPFEFWKFRTMVPNADQMIKQLEALNESKDGIHFKLKNDPRITPLGGFLRRYSIDELPQMFNIIMGEMSLVGPRPLSLRDYNKCAEHHLVRHQVIPGITGLWQVSGRSDILDFDDVVRLDIAYIENWSLWLDFQILLRTVVVVLGKKGAY
jgi:exopolysaccharide biosynthesis polyprenyl glycosylphosphotransferase